MEVRQLGHSVGVMVFYFVNLLVSVPQLPTVVFCVCSTLISFHLPPLVYLVHLFFGISVSLSSFSVLKHSGLSSCFVSRSWLDCYFGFLKLVRFDFGYSLLFTDLFSCLGRLSWFWTMPAWLSVNFCTSTFANKPQICISSASESDPCLSSLWHKGYFSLCCMNHDRFYLNLSFRSHPTLLKCKTRSLERPCIQQCSDVWYYIQK